MKQAWEARDVDAAVALFERTEHYYERPFKPATTIDEIRSYWQEITDVQDIRLDYSVAAVDGSIACVHWQNWFTDPKVGRVSHLDGMFQLEFDDEGFCREFRMWWFMEDPATT